MQSLRLSVNPYTNPELAEFLDCYECGQPVAAHAAETEAPASGVRGQLQYFLSWLALVMPGIGLAAGLTAIGYGLAAIILWTTADLGGAPVSSLLLAILLGLALRNTISVPAAYDAGLRWCARRALHFGIVLLGLRLSLSTAGQIGLLALPLVVVCITAGLGIVIVTGRVLGLSPRLASLIAVGTGICGVSAIAATAPSIDAEDDEVSYAIGCVTLFGLVALLGYPWLSHTVFDADATSAGLFLGTAVHDTSQVTGAALLYSQWYDAPQALEVATVTKLLRNLFIVLVLPLMAVICRKRKACSKSPRFSVLQAVPVFVLVFVLMVAIRTVGDLGDRPFGLLPPELWHNALSWSKRLTAVCLTLAMAAVGLGTSLSRLRRLGLKPLALGLVAAATVGLISFVLIRSGLFL